MLSLRAITDPQLVINNIPITYVPNSLKADLGLGEQSMKALGGGGGSTTTVYFANVETNVSKVTFEMFVTDASIELHQDWKALGNANAISIIEPNGVTLNFAFMAHNNKTEFEFGEGKMVTLEFEGNPATT